MRGRRRRRNINSFNIWSCGICILILASIIPITHQIRDTSSSKMRDDKAALAEKSASRAAEERNTAAALAPGKATTPALAPEPWTWRLKRNSIPPISESPLSPPAFTAQLQTHDDHVVVDNGIVRVTLSKPGGMITRIEYNDNDNLLEDLNTEDVRGYWDLSWSKPDQEHKGVYDRIEGMNFSVILEDPNQVELSFTRTWYPSLNNNLDLVPLNIDMRFIMLGGSSGFYSYAIYEHLEEWPAFNLAETRMVFKLSQDKFHYMAISDTRQRVMPMPEDRATGQPLAYPEAVLLTNPINPALKGEVDDKYQYSCDNKDSGVHGWICSECDPLIGFWMITPSNEFRTGGPLKQDLTSHVGPTTLAMFVSAHYGGDDVKLSFQVGEPWKKVFGPVFIYLNSFSDSEFPYTELWEDAKQQMAIQVQSWPYNFPVSDDFPFEDQRGTVYGRLLVLDRYISEDYIIPDFAYVGLAPPGEAGSWQIEGKGYQFWTNTDTEGVFSINNIREGDYNLYASIPGFIGDYKCDVNISISAGDNIDLGDLVYEPPREGPTLWEIGVPDRSAGEFYVPDPNPMYINKLYLSQPTSDGRYSIPVDKFRQYGLWERYADIYLETDLVYEIGISNYQKDWFFAQVTRKSGNNTYRATTWTVIFELETIDYNRSYKLRVALASATYADLLVQVNAPEKYSPIFATGLIGKDNAIARHGIHGLYRLYSIDVPGYLLQIGTNLIFLTQSRSNSPFEGIMYDYIRLEGPSGFD